MTVTSFVLRGLRFYRGSYVGVLAGAALGAMVLLGAVMAGDSVKGTLRKVAEARLGKVDAVLAGGDRMFRSALADDLKEVKAAPVMFLKATATAQASGRVIGDVQVLGVDKRFWKLSPGKGKGKAPEDREFFVNKHLARNLDLEAGEALVLRFEKPEGIASDAPLAGKAAELIALRGEVGKVCGKKNFGSFSLENTQLPQATVFVPIERLQQAIGFEGKANLMLMRDKLKRGSDGLSALIRKHCTLADYGLTVDEVPLADAVEVRTSRIFFDRQVADVIHESFPAAQPVITYMANTIAANDRETPYSMVTAVGPDAAPFLSGETNGAVLNAWQAGDLGAKAGDQLRIDYYALAAGNRLVERSATFPVAAVVPLEGLAADRKWMPDFPGVAEAENAADWDAGVPIDLKRIREKDEAYWDEYRGTPKVFLPLEKGRELFGNRWGEFTALRIPVALASKAEVSDGVLESMTPAVAGLVMQDVGRSGMAAAASPVDFAGLFLGMSLFLMAAAVALTAMMFRFHIELRNRESGLLAALGIPAAKVLRWRLLEGLCLVVAGTGIGSLLAVAYTRLLLAFLETIWSGPGSAGLFRFHVALATLAGGMAGFVCLMMLVIWLTARKQVRRSAGLRLEAAAEELVRKPAKALPWWAMGMAAAGLGALGGTAVLGAAAAFFLAGFAFLFAGLAAYRWLLMRRVAGGSGGLSARRLAELNCGRRATRSLVVTGSLACGVFLVVSVAAFRKHTGDEWRERDSGAGGFAFWVETTRPVDVPALLADEEDAFGRVIPLRAGGRGRCQLFQSQQRDASAIAGGRCVGARGAGCLSDQRRDRRQRPKLECPGWRRGDACVCG